MAEKKLPVDVCKGTDTTAEQAETKNGNIKGERTENTVEQLPTAEDTCDEEDIRRRVERGLNLSESQTKAQTTRNASTGRTGTSTGRTGTSTGGTGTSTGGTGTSAGGTGESARSAVRPATKSITLSVDLRQLERSKFPDMTPPKQLATLSTMVQKEKGTHQICNAEGCDKVTEHVVTELCSRDLNEDPVAQRMELVEPRNLKRVQFDLNVGYGKQIEKNRTNEHLSLLLECMLKEGLVGRSEFVCWRGLLTKLGASPYEASGKFDEGLMVVVQKIGDVFYLAEFPTKEHEKKEAERDERQKLMGYWGLKFESYVTAKSGHKPCIDEPMNFNDEFGLVVETKLGSSSLLCGGEVDCCFPKDNKTFIQLKTNRVFDHPRQERSFRRFKLMKWWLQSFLIGIDDIMCGFRDDDGIVQSCEWYKVSDIPRIIKQDRDPWKPAVCLAVIDSFLEFVKANVKVDHVPHVLTRRPHSVQFELRQDREGTYKFLPHWFVDHVCKNRQ